MPRPRLILALGLFACLSTPSAQAQYGWGGWGGFSSTVQGDIARGMGVFLYGAGEYNLLTAGANSINTDTWMRWNDYWYYSQQQATKAYLENKYKNIQNNKARYNEVMTRLRENPTAGDIENGDALNAALEQLSDPRIHTSALRSATTPIDAEMIRNIPFRNNVKAVTFVLADLREATHWPAVLDNERFALDKAVFEHLVDQARKEDEAGQISKDTLDRARALVIDLKTKLEANPLPDTADNIRAMKFVKSLAGLIRLLGQNDIREVLDELRKVKTTTAGALVTFMQAFNLRFGPATTPREKVVYREIYSILDQTRDKILAEAKLDSPHPPAGPQHVAEVFSALKLDQLQGKKTPAPPKPEQ